MFYQQYIGNETIETEYKEFTFNHINLLQYINMKEAQKLVESSEWVFNNLVLECLNIYANVYFPKYIAGFMNSKTSINKGRLYIGIDDNGICQGIPFKGIISQKYVKDLILKSMKKFITTSNDIKQYIKYKIIEVEYNYVEIPQINDKLETYINIMKEHDYKENEYKKALKRWHDRTIIVIQKLKLLFNRNPTRQQIYDYIYLHDNKSKVLELMDNNFELEQHLHGTVQYEKQNINSPYYWICKWKDETILECKKIKPIPYHRPNNISSINPLALLLKVSPMIKWWMQNNSDMKLYVIRITIIKPEQNIDIAYNDIFGNIHRCYRTIVDGNPCCVPL